MRAKRVDRNQSEIVEKLRKIPGISVTTTHILGDGRGDIIIGRQKKNWWIEIKDPLQPPSGRRLTDEEERFHNEWQGHIEVAETLEQILRIIGLQ